MSEAIEGELHAAEDDRADEQPDGTEDDETGTGHTVVGIPPDAPDELAGASTSWEPATIPPPGEPGTARGPVSEEWELRLEGQQGPETITVTPHEGSLIFPSWWLTANGEMVEALSYQGTTTEAEFLAATFASTTLNEPWISDDHITRVESNYYGSEHNAGPSPVYNWLQGGGPRPVQRLQKTLGRLSVRSSILPRRTTG